ncbi:MAG: sugar transferase, partial [Acidimicrobiia bacterium]
MPSTVTIGEKPRSLALSRFSPREEPANGTSRLRLKRVFDLSLSGIGLLVSSPLWAVFAAAIKLEDGGPVFYGQDRVGQGGRVFKTLKFRSMVPDAEVGLGAIQSVEHDLRVTRVGRWLRATAMDELPQLLNIFRGEMSFVGPRPLRPGEIETNGVRHCVSIDLVPGFAQR